MHDLQAGCADQIVGPAHEFEHGLRQVPRAVLQTQMSGYAKPAPTQPERPRKKSTVKHAGESVGEVSAVL